MRLGRWLLVAAILVISAAVGVIYVKTKASQVIAAPAPPPKLEKEIQGRAEKWTYTQSDGDRPRVRIRADKFRQVKDPSVMELEGVELEIFHKDGKKFDLVKSDKVEFDIPAKSLYSEGEVEITMAVEDGVTSGRLMKIHTSGARFASDTGIANTDRHATFEFDRGGGSATGIDYDPSKRELHLKADVSLDWHGQPGSEPMHAESGEAFYYEKDAKVVLYPWSKLQRENLTLDAKYSNVFLKEGRVDRAEIEAAKGVQDDDDRKVEFAADKLDLDFTLKMQVKKVAGEGNASIVSTTDTAKTTITGKHVDMDMAEYGKTTVLANAVAIGSSSVEAVPLGKPAAQMPDTRVLKSDTIRLKMRAPAGREVESVETDGAGTLDFLPNRPGQPKRFLSGDKFWIAYGAQNRIQTFRSVNVKTRTERPPTPKEPMPPVGTTESQEILATFNPTTSELDKIEQNKAFHYQEGERQARADRATLDQAKDVINLDGSARVWDPTGLSLADHIVMNQKTGDYVATGHVASTREPDKKGQSSAMLSNEQVLEARADRMTAADSHRKIHYEGNAVAWQGANRVEADKIDIDRQRHVMEAHGRVVSQFVDKSDDDKKDDGKKDDGKKKQASSKQASSKNDAKKKDDKPKPTVFTVVRASDLTYTDETRVALYQGGVSLVRPGLTVDGKTVRAFLKNSDDDSSLDKAIADGDVKIVSTGVDKRIRTGTADHSEYYTDDQRVILQGGSPSLIDSLKGRTTGAQLTWFANNDRLLVNGAESKPTESVLKKK